MEAIVGRVLQKYFVVFLKNFRRKDFHIGAISGESVLENLDVNEKTLQEILRVPQLEVQSCKIGKLRIKVSITRISSVPVRVSIDHVTMELKEPTSINPLPSIVANLLKKEEKASETEEDEADKKSGYKMGDKIADGISVSIGRIEVNIQTLGLYKTDVFGAWTPKQQRLVIEDVELDATNSDWEVVDLKEARKSGQLREGDERACFDIFQRVKIGNISFQLIPSDRQEPVTVITDMPAELHITTRKSSEVSGIIARQVDFRIPNIQGTVNSQQMTWFVDIIQGLADSMSRKSLEGDEYKVICKVKKGTDLLKPKKSDLADPMVHAILRGWRTNGEEYKTYEQTTAIQKKTLNPEWDESFDWIVYRPDTVRLVLSVWNKGRVGKEANSMGVAFVELEPIKPDKGPQNLTVSLGKGAGTVELEIEVFNWTQKIKPRPRTFINLSLGHIDLGVKDSLHEGQIVYLLGRRIRLRGETGLGIGLTGLNVSLVMPPVSEVSDSQEMTVQMGIDDISIRSLDSDRQSDLELSSLIRKAPPFIAQAHMAQSKVEYKVCAIRPSGKKDFPVLKKKKPVGKVDIDPRVDTSPQFLQLTMTHTLPVPKPPLDGPVCQIIVFPVEVILDPTVLERFAGLLSDTLSNRPRPAPPARVLRVLEKEKMEQEASDAMQRADRAKSEEEIALPPIVTVNIEFVCLLLHVPSPARLTNPRSPALFLELSNVHVISRTDLTPPDGSVLYLSTFGERVFPVDGGDFKAQNSTSFAVASGIKPTSFVAEWELMTCYLRPFPKAPSKRLFSFREMCLRAQLQTDYIVKAIADHLPSISTDPALFGGMTVGTCDGEVSEVDYKVIMSIVSDFQRSGFSEADVKRHLAEEHRKEKEKQGDDVDEEPDEAAILKKQKEDEEKRLQSLVKGDALMGRLPALFWCRMEEVSVTLLREQGVERHPEPLSRLFLNIPEFVLDNNPTRSCVKSVIKSVELYTPSRTGEEAILKCVSKTLMAPNFPSFYALRFVRMHGIMRLESGADGLDRGEVVMRFGGVHAKGHLLDIIPFLTSFVHKTVESPTHGGEAIPIEKPQDGIPLNMPQETTLVAVRDWRVIDPSFAKEEDVALEGMLHLEGFFSFARKAVHNAYDRCGKIRDKLIENLSSHMHKLEPGSERLQTTKRHALILPLALDLNGKKHAVISSWSDIKMCPVTHQGYMVKHARSASNNWKLRYHRLIQDELYYFRREDAIAPLGHMNIRNCAFQLVDRGVFNRDHVFQLQTSTEKMFFACESREDLIAWAKAIKFYQRIVTTDTSAADDHKGDGSVRVGQVEPSHEGGEPEKGAEIDDTDDAVDEGREMEIAQEEFERTYQTLGECVRGIDRAANSVNAVFHRIPILYKAAQGVRTDILSLQVRKLNADKTLLAEQFNLKCEESARYERQVRHLERALNRELTEGRMKMHSERAEFAHVSRHLQRRERLLLGVILEASKHDTFKQKQFMVFKEEGVLKIGWGSMRTMRMENSYPVRDILSVDPIFDMPDPDRNRRSFSIQVKSAKPTPPFVFTCETSRQNRDMIVGIESFIEDVVPFSADRHQWTDGSILWKYVSDRITKIAQKHSKSFWGVVIDAMQKVDLSKVAREKEEEFGREYEDIARAKWVKLHVRLPESPEAETAQINGASLHTLSDLETRVRHEFRLPVLDPELGMIWKITVRFNDPTHGLLILGHDHHIQDVLAFVDEFFISVEKKSL
eukprot:TRINITY_DN463_c1_g2_i1.p1 TRINITY_DN463_c1_g2~~TRINITY_DN463_c1_g2_i1.p1  ORF type:complete len:1747 (-),score=463.92 TRINITY_DN463_c1_g2_i1:2035-7194(-)